MCINFEDCHGEGQIETWRRIGGEGEGGGGWQGDGSSRCNDGRAGGGEGRGSVRQEQRRGQEPVAQGVGEAAGDGDVSAAGAV